MNVKKMSRILKVYRKIIPQPKVSKCVPQIRLQGNWLEEEGFEPGKQVAIYPVEGGGLLIKPLVQ